MSETMEIEESTEIKKPLFAVGDTALCYSRSELYVARVFLFFVNNK